MKTPLDNFELEYESFSFTPEGGNHPIYGNIITLAHKVLPILFKRKCEWTWKVGENSDKLVNSSTLNVFKDVINWANQGKAQTFYTEFLGYKKHPNGKPGYIYQPEYDKEKEAWFVLDENNNKIYE